MVLGDLFWLFFLVKSSPLGNILFFTFLEASSFRIEEEFATSKLVVGFVFVCETFPDSCPLPVPPWHFGKNDTGRFCCAGDLQGHWTGGCQSDCWSDDSGCSVDTRVLLILLMAEILHQLIGSLSHYLQGFIHPRWLAGFLPSTVLPTYGSITTSHHKGPYKPTNLYGTAHVSTGQNSWINRVVRSCLELWSGSGNLHNR